MKQFFTNQLSDGMSLEKEAFALQDLAVHKDKNGNTYYRLVLQDKAGDIAGKVWSDSISQCKITTENIGDVLEVSGSVSSYQGKLQATIKSCKVSEEYNLEDLIQVTDKGIEPLFEKLKVHIDSIQDRHLKRLFENMLSDKEFIQKFKESPAAEKLHHDFVGGLLEHIVELLESSDGAVEMYPEANIDLVKAGLILHDIGKIEELERVGTSFTRTIKGRLIGHLILSIEIVKKYLPKDFPEELWVNLWHILLSHHGMLEYGSPVLPKTIEASIVHSLDIMSSKVRLYSRELMLAEEGRDFSDKVWALGTDVYLKQYKSDTGKTENNKAPTPVEAGGEIKSADPDQVALI